MKKKFLSIDPIIPLSKFQVKDFDIMADDKKELREKLKIMIPKTIIGVDEEAVASYLAEEGVRRIRYKQEKMPDKFDLKTNEDFLRIMAILIPLSERN